jgi:hypothetical protein
MRWKTSERINTKKDLDDEQIKYEERYRYYSSTSPLYKRWKDGLKWHS